MPRRNRYEEQQLQKAAFEFFDLALPPDATAFPIPNGGKRSKTEAAIFKGYRMVRAGVLDAAIIWRGKIHMMEFKRPGEGLTLAQELFAADLQQAGGIWGWATRIEHVEGLLRGWGIPLRATLEAGHQGRAG